MEDNKEKAPETTEETGAKQEAGAADQGAQGSKNEKLFTQADVDRIVKERLKRSKAKAEEDFSEEINNRAKDLAAREETLKGRESDMSAKESRLKCKEYLLDNHLPGDLLEILDTNDVETFKKKAEKVSRLTKTRRTAPIASSDNAEAAADGFSREVKHKPKPYFTSDY